MRKTPPRRRRQGRYASKLMKMVIAQCKRDKGDLEEENAILDMHKAALGTV
ncbi:GapR family DNA-binding domain-containing protein [Paracoccus sp. (in: a-proteobacteria)]|uniref:GapR family DNA-binding domain-containing protein n=1 Tax=Paracoccus sp. TaxID=267 RepID=UPI00321FC2F2